MPRGHRRPFVVRSTGAIAVKESDPKLISLTVHALRSPVHTVGGYLRMLQRDTHSPLTERRRKMVDEAEESCGKLVALVAPLGKLGKMDDV